MKKAIVSIIILALLINLNIVNISAKENINLTNYNNNGFPDVSLIGESVWSLDLYIPGELIIGFKEGTQVSISSISYSVLTESTSYATTTTGTTSTSFSPIGQTSTGDQTAYPEEIIVTGIETIDELNIKYGCISSEKFIQDDSIPKFSNIYKFTFSTDILLALGDYLNDSNVDFVEPNYIYHPLDFPNDPYFSQQWALHNTGQIYGTMDADIDAPEAWDIQKGSSDIIIAIIDTGVDTTHPDLAANIVPGGFTGDWYGHGTHCAGIAAAVTNNGIGVAGVARNCKIMPFLAMGPLGLIAEFLITYDIINATRNGADVISMSLGGLSEGILMKRAIDYADLHGVVIVAAAGNDDTNVPIYPAGNPKVIAVGATDYYDKRTFFSSYGGWVDVSAPGLYINSTWVGGDYLVASGTSMATPHVAGLAALILSEKPYLTPGEVRTIIRSSVDPVDSSKHIGTGRINAYKALQKAAHVVSELDNSLDDKSVSGKVKIMGVAKGVSFQKYTVQYGKGIYPDQWEVFKVSYSRNYGGTPLAVLDTFGLEEGLYSIKLILTTTNGYTYEDMTTIIVDNIVETHYVDVNGGVKYTCIQDAIDNCGDKDTIYVYSGIYNEHLSLGSGRTIKLVGQNKQNTIIDSSDYDWILSTIGISRGTLIISGFTIKPYCLTAVVTSNSKIDDNKFIGSGIYSGITILGFNPLMPSLVTSSDNTISSNTLSPVNCSISIMGCRKNSISDNILLGGDILLLCSNKNNINNNNVQLIDLFASSDNNIYENQIYSGLELLGSSLNNINDNTISKNNGIGIDIQLGVLFASSFNKISKNIIKNTNKGIYIAQSTGFDVFSNNFNLISENEISNNDYGIYIEANNNHTEIFNNNFIQNNIHAYDAGSNNLWYRPLLMLGNFWDDYTIKYPNAQPRLFMPWLWDTPYDIDGGNSQDLYPLVNQYDSSASYITETQYNTEPSSEPSSQTTSTTMESTTSSTTSK
jgi:thermitase